MEAQFRALAFGGVSESMREYGKTTFTHEEDERCHLYTLHLALVMKTECYYKQLSLSDDVSNLSKQLTVPTLQLAEGELTCAGYMGYPPSKLIVYLFSYLVL